MIDLVRYLCVWRVNRSQGCISAYPAVQISRVLGTIISEHLGTKEARHWHKALKRWKNFCTRDQKEVKYYDLPSVSNAPWPVEVSIVAHTSKKIYGLGEPLIWELKLFGECARHSFFLESILPAMEKAGYTSISEFNRRNSLWGHFDITDVYCAHGHTWEPVVQNGQLDTTYEPSPSQWIEGLSEKKRNHIYNRLIWATPFDLNNVSKAYQEQSQNAVSLRQGLNMEYLLNAFVNRCMKLGAMSGGRAADLTDILSQEVVGVLDEAMSQSKQLPHPNSALTAAPAHMPGSWTGYQVFGPIPSIIIPFLKIASILHLGNYTHFGCGTFYLE